MTVDRRSLVARSMAALDDQGSIETRPLADIKADLEALGIDPSASIRAAHARARERTSPAERLLARLDETDASSADIDALEAANIDDIKNAVPKGAAASLAADAKRRAGVPSNITRLRRPSGRFWGWGGSMVGLAACLLLFFITRPDLLDQIEPSMVEEVDDVGELPQSAAVAEADTDRSLEVEESLDFAEEAVTAADAVSTTARSREREQAPASIQRQERSSTGDQRATVRMKKSSVGEASGGSVETDQELVQSLSEADIENLDEAPIIAAAPALEPTHHPMMKPLSPSHQPEVKPLPLPYALHSGEVTAEGKSTETTEPMLSAQEAISARVATIKAGWGGPEALLIVDPNATPVELKALAKLLPERRLIDRLEEARALLGERRPVLALMTVQRNGVEVDVIVTSREDGNRVELLNSFTDHVDGTDQAFEIIDLPRSP